MAFQAVFQDSFQIAGLRRFLCSEMIPWVVAEHFLHHFWPCLALPTTQPAPSRAIFLAPGTRDCFAEAPQQTLKQIYAKKCSDGASRSVINLSHCHFWVPRACFAFGLSVLWAGLAKCAKTESSEPICLRSPLTSLCI